MRYLKYLPIIVPVVLRFIRSPQGKSAITKAKASRIRNAKKQR